MRPTLRLFLLLLAWTALGRTAAWAATAPPKSVVTGITQNLYPIPALSGTPDALNGVRNYRFETIPAAAAGWVGYPQNVDGTSTNGYYAATANTTITIAQAANLVFQPAAGATVGTASFSYTFGQTVLATGLLGTQSGAATYTLNLAVADAKTSPVLSNSAGQRAIPTLTAGTYSPTNYSIVTLPSTGTLYVNGAAATVGQLITAAQAAQLTYAAATNYSGTTSFTYAPADAAGYKGDAATYAIPVSTAPCGNNSALDFSRLATGDDWKNHASVAVNASNVSSGGFTSPVTGANSTFAVGSNAALPGPSLVWRQDYTGLDPATTPNTSTVTFTFDRPVNSLSLSIQDIDKNITGTASFLDEVTFNGYSTAASTTPIALTAGNFALASTNQLLTGTNTVQGTGNSDATAAGNIVVTFTSPVQRLTLIYKNTAPYVSSTNTRAQAVGITSMVWCRLPPVANNVTSATVPSTAGQVGINSLSSTVDGTVTTYTIVSIPNATTQGTLYYNTTGTAYAAVASGQTLTLAQANSLRFDPVDAATGNVTFTYTVQDSNGQSSNTATYTIPVQSFAACATVAATLDFSSRPANEDWKMHAALSVPATSTQTTVSAGTYTTGATSTSSLQIGPVNSATSLAWTNQYTSTTPGTGTTPGAGRSSSVTFTFNRPVTNFTVQVQDIDVNDANGSNFIDQVVFSGSNSGAAVTPTLTTLNANTGSVSISGNTATGQGYNTTNGVDGTVIAYFPGPINSLTITYNNTSTVTTPSTPQGIGIDNMTWCRLAPVASNITNTARDKSQGTTVINSLSAAAVDGGTIASYTIAALPAAAQGTYYVNGVVLNAANFPNLRLTPTQATQLSFAPAATFSGTAGFSYYATDDAGGTSNTATYTLPITNTGPVGTPALCATPGKDLAGTLSTAASPNTYYPSNGAQALAVGATTLSLGAATGANTPITAGDLLLVIQMQGATIDATNAATYGTVSSTGYTAGQYEYVVANSPVPVGGGSLTLRTGLKNAYSSAVATATAGQRSFQVVRVPQYTTLTLSSNLAATPWNGSSGGIIALDVAGQTDLAGRTISATGAGFRGGAGRALTGIGTAAGYTATDYRNLAGTSPTGTGGTKGEGTAGTPRYVSNGNALVDTRTSINGLPVSLTDGYPNGDNDRGAPGNAGGGGTDTSPSDNSENSGGGGGANGGSGGRGGNAWSSGSAVGGEPGAAFAAASTSRLVLGGGGGSGSTNNGTSNAAHDGFTSSGAAGGGIIILRTGTLVAAGGSAITANGASASISVANDGSGGGGAGGSILITTTSGGLGSLTLNATGGTGGSNTPGGTIAAHGPGGGGGGGVIFSNASATSATVTAGTSGTSTVTNVTTTSVAFGAGAGVTGVVNAQISPSIANSTSGAYCASADVTVSLAGPTTLNAGQPTGNFTATFTNEGPGTATNVTRIITLPAGAYVTPAQQATIKAAYPNATFSPANTPNVINFGNIAADNSSSTLASDVSNTVVFAFTAPAAVGASTLTGNVTTAASEAANPAPNQSTLAITTITTADVKAAITASTDAAGTTGTFNVTFSNIGAQAAAGVVRTVQLRRNLTGVTVTGSDAGTYDPTTGLVTYTTSPTTLAAGGVLTSSIAYPLANSVTPVTATAAISTTTNEASLQANNTATAVMPASFDLATTLTGPTTTIAGSPTVLYVTTSNNGPNSAPVTTQTVDIPSAVALTNVYMTNGGTYSYNTGTKIGTVTFPVPNLSSGATVTNSVSFTVPVNDTSPTDTSAPSATAAVMPGETSTSNNTAYLNGNTTSTSITVLGSTTTTNNTIAKANEQTTIVANATIVDAGTVVTYTVTATNAGSPGTTSVASVVEKVQLLPGLTASTLTVGTSPTVTTLGNGNIQYVTTSGITTYNPSTGVLTYPTISSQVSGTTQTFDKLFVTVPTTVGNDGQLLATASVSTAGLDPIPADNTSSVVVKVKTTADLATALTGPTTTTAGQTASYTATFRNGGPGTASFVVETVQLPVGLNPNNVVVQDPSGNAVNNAYNALTGLVTIPTVASDASGITQVYNISFPAPGQSFVVSSNISSGTVDNAVANNASAVSTSVSPTADVAIYASGPATAVSGNAVTYAVTATNNGPNLASTVTPRLQLPAGLVGTGAVVTNPDGSTNNGVVVSGNGTYNATTGAVTFPTVTLVSGDSRVGLVTFTMPSSPTNGFLTGAASYSFGGTTPSVDVVSSNNTAAITTSIAPATPDVADLTATITPPVSPTVAGSSISYGLAFRNNSTTTPALKVMPVAYLPVGLTGVVIKDGNGAVVPAATYNSTTGQVTFPTIDSQAAGNATSYTISLTAPGNDVVVSASSVSSNTSDPDPSNNFATNTLTVTPSYDVVTKLTGPTSATPGSTNTYTVTTTNNGFSTSPTTANTTQTVMVPANSTVTGLPATASYDSSSGVITFATVNGQATGANGAVINTFTVQMPATGTLPLQANVTLTGESNPNNNQDILTTLPFNTAPVAQNVWNTLRSARGNTSTGLPISSLLATDDGSITGYTVVSAPSLAQGTLYFNGSPVLSGQKVSADGLSFVPTAGYVGDATFTYTATDNGGAPSNVALYTIPVAADRDAQYATYNNGRAGGTYTVGTVLAQVIDPNAAVYSNAGIIYDNNGVLQAGAANGLPLTGTNATVPAGTLPMGVSLDAATGRIYVSGPLANSAAAQTYNLSVTTTDSNGGITIVPVTFTIGANPLPVVLVSFAAQAVANRDALLSWSTASEKNNDHFEVERSFDGSSFALLSRVAGHGTTSAAAAYTFTDAGIGRQVGSRPVYYRLRQVDVDGQATYSTVRSVSFTEAAPVVISLYPNPAQTFTTVELSQLPATSTYQVLVLDATGRSVLSTTLAGGTAQRLDVSGLATGTYTVLVTGTRADGSPLRQALRLTKE